jgi:2Fe-2S ferredoxin
MLRKLAGKVLRRIGGDTSRPVTQATPDDWNRVDRAKPAPGAGEFGLTFSNLDVTLLVARGTTILDAAADAGLDLNHYCGGMCSCGSCRVVVVSGDVSPMDDMEDATLSVVREGEQDRLGCQTKVLGDVVVEVPDQQF